MRIKSKCKITDKQPIRNKKMKKIILKINKQRFKITK